jgi:hypothetical protein
MGDPVLKDRVSKNWALAVVPTMAFVLLTVLVFAKVAWAEEAVPRRDHRSVSSSPSRFPADAKLILRAARDAGF